MPWVNIPRLSSFADLKLAEALSLGGAIAMLLTQLHVQCDLLQVLPSLWFPGLLTISPASHRLEPEGGIKPSSS